MSLWRKLKHLTAAGWLVRRAFRKDDLEAIAKAVRQSEQAHRGEICVVIEGPLPFSVLWHDTDCRSRAAELFKRYQVDQTREASGILIYVQLLDRQVEILADTGIAARVAPAEWAAICHDIEAAFAAGAWQKGLLDAVDRMTALLSMHFPATTDNPDELDNRPKLL